MIKTLSFVKTKIKLTILIFALLIVSGIVFGVLHSLYHESSPVFRPMIFYNNTLFWDEKVVDGSTDGLEYIGTVNSSVPNGEKPENDFECNSEDFLNAKLYCDGNGVYYLLCTNGNLLLLEGNGSGTDNIRSLPEPTILRRDVGIPPYSE